MSEGAGRFPPVIPWEPDPYPPGYIVPEEWYSHQYPIIKKFFQKKMDGWNLGDFLLELGCKNVVLYAMTDFLDLAARDLMHSTPNIYLKYFACNDAYRYPDGYLAREVCDIEKLAEDYKSGGVDKIVVCSIFHANEIFTDLLFAGIKLQDLISINTIIFD